jgi:hypothetical protein
MPADANAMPDAAVRPSVHLSDQILLSPVLLSSLPFPYAAANDISPTKPVDLV